MKRLIALFLIAIMLLVMSSCSTNSVESTSAEILTSETTMVVETESSASAVEEKSMIAEREIKVLDYTDSKKQIFIYRDDVELSGVLYLPDGDGPFPVMIFASAIGSGYEYVV